jgi:ankyrin repeat protein
MINNNKLIYFLFIALHVWQSYSQTSPEQLAKTAYQALQELSIDKARTIINQAVARFKNNPEAFLKFINTIEDDWTMLMLATALDDAQRINMIIDAAVSVFGNNTTYLTKMLSAQNQFGETAMFTAGDYNNLRALRLLLERGKTLLHTDKKGFLQFINTAEKADLWTPLMAITYANANRALHAIINAATEVLGVDSPEFAQFINAENIYYENALSLTLDERSIHLLKQHGARPASKQIDEIRKEWHSMGKQLLHVVKHMKATKELQKILDAFAEKYPNDYNGYFHFVTTRDEAGWTAFMNAVASGNLEFMDILFYAAKKYYHNNPDWQLYILMSADIHGRISLHLAIARHHYAVVERLLAMHKELLGNDKTYYIQLINYQNELAGFTPLINATYISENNEESRNLIILLLKRSEEVFGLNNAWYNSFINRTDFNNYTALTYVTVPTLRALLKRYGARDPLEPIYPRDKQKRRTAR